MDILTELETRTMLGDGAMGTELWASGIPREQCLEELCISDPDRISRIHDAYIAAGAQLIRTHSFGANALRLARHGLENHVNEFNWTAARLARQAAQGKRVFVAGSVGPLGISKAEAEAQGLDRAAIYREQIGALLDGGVDLICFETFQDVGELSMVLYIKQSLHHCPAITSLAPNASGLLPSGQTLADAFAQLRQNDADIFGVNCVNGLPTALQILDGVLPSDVPLSFFPNAGIPTESDGGLRYDATPAEFAAFALELRRRGVHIIGGCCGFGPAHIAAAAEAFRGTERSGPSAHPLPGPGGPAA